MKAKAYSAELNVVEALKSIDSTNQKYFNKAIIQVQKVSIDS